jgi:hypothetical protein
MVSGEKEEDGALKFVPTDRSHANTYMTNFGLCEVLYLFILLYGVRDMSKGLFQQPNLSALGETFQSCAKFISSDVLQLL